MFNGAQTSGLFVSVHSVTFLDHSDPYFGQFIKCAQFKSARSQDET